MTAWIGVSLLAVMTAWNMVLQVQVEVQALRAQAGAMALSVAPPSVGDSANAAPLYEKARSMTGIGEENAADDKGVDYQALEADDPRVGAYVQRHAKRLDILRPRGRYAGVCRGISVPGCGICGDFARGD